MKKFLFIFLTCSILFLPNLVRSDAKGELVEIYLINQLDDQRGYCVDIKGYKSRAKINRGIQAHTCYSYPSNPSTPDTVVYLSEFFLPGFNLE